MGSSYTTNVNGATLGGSLSYTSTSKNAGDYSTAANTLTLSGLYSGQQGYDISYGNATLTISKAELQVSGLSGVNRVYDTTRAAQLSGTASVTALGSDQVSLDGNATGQFSNKNAGDNKAITLSGLTLSGADAGNYRLVLPTNLTANISRAEISAVTGITAEDKTYDGSTTATLNTSNASFTGLIGSDVLTVSGTGAFADKNAGENKTVNISGLTLGGADAGNYILVNNTANTTASILPPAQNQTTHSGIVESTLRQLAHEQGQQSGAVTLLHELSGAHPLEDLLEQVLITDNRNN
ncbi:YDG domain-containing protein [Pseudomonas chengduensis]|nr:YDG domain-containing protein [Pseudomonas chengduensis]MDH1866514.1 YDG domain-containing protein [Pseudomonas chengduensis]